MHLICVFLVQRIRLNYFDSLKIAACTYKDNKMVKNYENLMISKESKLTVSFSKLCADFSNKIRPTIKLCSTYCMIIYNTI